MRKPYRPHLSRKRRHRSTHIKELFNKFNIDYEDAIKNLNTEEMLRLIIELRMRNNTKKMLDEYILTNLDKLIDGFSENKEELHESLNKLHFRETA